MRMALRLVCEAYNETVGKMEWRTGALAYPPRKLLQLFPRLQLGEKAVDALLTLQRLETVVHCFRGQLDRGRVDGLAMLHLPSHAIEGCRMLLRPQSRPCLHRLRCGPRSPML